MTSTTTPTLPNTGPEKGNSRTEAALNRLHKAMADVEADIAKNGGIYPFNHGRVTQSELCRRADVKKATLQNPLHKDSTRVDIVNWLGGLNSTLTQTRESTRERVTAIADGLAAEVERLTLVNQELQMRLTASEQLVAQLRQENARLKAG